MPIKTIFLAIRPPFLLLTVACCLLAFSMATASGLPIKQSLMLPIFLLALFAHISVNILNEYLDFTNGLDLKTLKTPFSGGSGALPQHPNAAKAVLVTSVLALLVTSSLGLYLIFKLGLHLLLPGLLGLVIIVTYSRWINRSPWLCLIAPGLGFGLLMVAGSYVALVGELNIQIILVSLIPFFLVNNLLLLNQYPDIEADKTVGRNHFPIRFGVSVSNRVYLLFMLAAFALLAMMVVNQMLPLLGLVALIPLLPGLFAFSGAVKYREQIGQQPQYLGANVAMVLLTPFLLSMVLFIS